MDDRTTGRIEGRGRVGAHRASLAGCAALLALVGFASARASAQATEDDIFLFTSSVAPNVLFMLDNSGSMDTIVWHPAYNPAGVYDCNAFTNTTVYGVGATGNYTFCGRTRRLYHDSTSNGNTRYDGHYLNWIFSSQNTVQAEINTNNNGVRVCAGGSSTYPKYQLNRLSLAKRVVLDTMCQVNATKTIRFGVGVFREQRDAGLVDPNGGYVEVAIADNSATHVSNLESSIMGARAESWTPLAETLFQFYQYFMSRTAANLPAPATSGSFETYEYQATASSGGGPYTATASQRPDSPIQYTCQKNFVVVVTDGFSTRDDFDQDPANTARGFASFTNTIGDFNADGETEVLGDASESTRYLDDIAKFMRNRDCRPDLTGTQTIDTYTIGFTTDATANALLEKTAQQGNGLFYTSNNPEELRTVLNQAINDIIEKAQSFTAATVPSTRTTSGGSFYQSFFLPSAKTPFWEGHLRAYHIDAKGDVYGQSGVCAFIDPTPGECNSGPQNPAVVPFWDAGEQVPLPGSRNLYTSKVSSGTPGRVAFDDALTAADLTVATFTAAPAPAPNPLYADSGALTAEGLADEIVSYVRGCAFGSGVTAGTGIAATVACVPRTWRLGDIFHSGPAVVVAPRAPYREASYAAFKTNYKSRQRVIYAGANDGFLHAFNAGTLDTLVTPPAYTNGTGVELFGFMPWEARKNIKRLYVDDPTARTYYVDGSPQVVDTWIRSSATDTTKASTEWKSVLIGGMRQGGRAYYALDVTDPTAAGYPGYLWEFPNETDPDSTAVATSILPYLGQSWSQPIVTRVKVKINTNDNGGAGFERWVAIVTGGYDPTGDPNNTGSYVSTGIKGRAILMIDIATGKLLAMKRYDSTATDAQANMVYAIPTTPAVVDLNNDGFADVIYVGDLGGQVFKWVVKAIGEDRVNDSSTAGTYTQPNWPFKRFFTAPITTVGATSYYKSFFFPPQLTYVGKTLYIAFGSGERMNVGFAGVAGEDENNRYYAMTDLDPLELASTPYATLSESDLTNLSAIASPSCSDVTGRGYYFKTADGEKFVTNAEIFNRYVFAGSFQPTTTADPCTSKGIGRLYAFRVDCGQTIFLDSLNNGTRSVELGDGMPTDPQISIGVNGKDNRIYIEKSGADLESIGAQDLDMDDGSLLYWRERN